MRFLTFLRQANSILKSIFSYWQKRRSRRLYQQWMESAGLLPEDVPQEEAGERIIPKIRIAKEKLRRPLLFMLLGACLAILLMGLILLLIYSC